MIRPMPSPAGSNIEKLYILRGRGSPNSPQAAYDAAPNGPRTASEGARYGAAVARRLLGGRQTIAYDEVPDTYASGAGAGASNSDAVGQILKWCLENLTESDRDTLARRLTDDRATEVDRGRPAMDGHRPSRGMSASASKSFHEMFPDAARIRTY